MELTYGMVKRPDIRERLNQNKSHILKSACDSVGKEDRFPNAFLCEKFRQIQTQVHCRGPPGSLFVRRFENKEGGKNSGIPI